MGPRPPIAAPASCPPALLLLATLLPLAIPCALPFAPTTQPLLSVPRRQRQQQPKQVCYEPLGCFSMEKPWRSLLRPLPPPASPEKIGTTFYWYTRERRGRPARVRVPEDTDGVANTRRPTFFITHGFISNSSTPWMQQMKDALLDQFDANVFLTDWGPGAAGGLNYAQAAANTRVVGAQIARILQHSINRGMEKKKIHLIGHSLGAQISAYAGKRIKDIGKITALDPAQPAFEGYDQRVRLDASDAAFVQVVHTNAIRTIPRFGLGMVGQYGHKDYYINNGHTQPGCLRVFLQGLLRITSIADFFKLPVAAISNLLSCSHRRATKIFIEVIRQSNCTFWGYPRSILKDVVGNLTSSTAECSLQSCSPLKLRNEEYPARGAFTVRTAARVPFCIPEPEVDARMTQKMRALKRGREGGGGRD